MKYFNINFILLIVVLVTYPCQVISCTGLAICNDTYCFQQSFSLPLVNPCIQVSFVDCAQPPVLVYAISLFGSQAYTNNISIYAVVPNFVDTYTWKISIVTCSISFGIPNGIPYPVDILYYLQFGVTVSATCGGSYTWNGVVTLGDNNLQYCHNYSDCNSCVGNSNCVWCSSNSSCLAGDYQKEKCNRCPNFQWGGACTGEQDNTGSANTKKVNDAVVATVSSLGVILVVGISAGCFVLYFNPGLCMTYRKKIPFLNRASSFTTQEPSQAANSFIGSTKSNRSTKSNSSTSLSPMTTITSPNSSKPINSTLNSNISTSNINNSQRFIYDSDHPHGYTPPVSNSRFISNTTINNNNT